jgi:uncharacterized membrane protein YqaE (UPF0057 family)
MDVFAIFFPPLAVLWYGTREQAMRCIVLTLCGWLPGVVYAIMIVEGYKRRKEAERRTSSLAEQNNLK